MSMKNYLQDAQMELFAFSILTEFLNSEGYALSPEQQQAVIERSITSLKALGYDDNIVVDSNNIEDLKLSIQRLAVFSMQLFSLYIMHSAREEKYKEIISSLKDKKDD
jgi:hypothetical protein